MKNGMTNICECGKPFKSVDHEWVTLVGYSSPPGHNHDDNCKTRVYTCADGHQKKISIRRRCFDKECDWVGNAECGCHDGPKVDAWPELGEK